MAWRGAAGPSSERDLEMARDKVLDPGALGRQRARVLQRISSETDAREGKGVLFFGYITLQDFKHVRNVMYTLNV